MEAIVLARRDFREFDQIISLYTKEKGKIEVLARGVKKITSKNTAHLEPFSYCFVEVVKGREIDHLTKVVPIKMFPNIRTSFARSVSASYATSFVGKLTEVGEPDKNIWQLFLSWLLFLDKAKKFNPLLLDSFMLKSISLLGLKPVLDHCVVSGQPYKDLAKQSIQEGAPVGFYFAGGGLVSAEAAKEKKQLGEDVVLCGVKEISDMQILLHANWQVINDFKIEEYKKVHRLVYLFLSYHSEKKVEDWSKLSYLYTS